VHHERLDSPCVVCQITVYGRRFFGTGDFERRPIRGSKSRGRECGDNDKRRDNVLRHNSAKTLKLLQRLRTFSRSRMMKLSDLFLPEFEQEMTTARKTLERIPEDKLGWKPHEK